MLPPVQEISDAQAYVEVVVFFIVMIAIIYCLIPKK